jgi:cytoplasmic iron level regulating protein YaaA (DUF328/UPF0246 family)
LYLRNPGIVKNSLTGEIAVPAKIPLSILLIIIAPTMPALQRYDGTLYDAIDYESLTEVALERAREIILIQSAMFGLISASDRIPKYRLSATTVLEKFSLREHWSNAHQTVFSRLAHSAPLIDLRSKSYAELAPIPQDIEHYWVEVVTIESDGRSRALNHFNKKSNGLLVRAILDAKQAPKSLSELTQIAETIGFALTLEQGQLRLTIPGS